MSVYIGISPLFQIYPISRALLTKADSLNSNLRSIVLRPSILHPPNHYSAQKKINIAELSWQWFGSPKLAVTAFRRTAMTILYRVPYADGYMELQPVHFHGYKQMYPSAIPKKAAGGYIRLID